jgi:hypothetical protein
MLTCLLALVLSGCTTIEGGTTWHIVLRNDTNRFVVVRACTSEGCSKFRYARRINAGHQVSATDYGDGRSWWVVLDRTGRRLGCATLNFNDRHEGTVLLISRMIACPSG